MGDTFVPRVVKNRTSSTLITAMPFSSHCNHRLHHVYRKILLTLLLAMVFYYVFVSIQHFEPVVYVLEPGIPLVRVDASSEKYQPNLRSEITVPNLRINSDMTWADTRTWSSTQRVGKGEINVGFTQCQKLISGDDMAQEYAHRFMATNTPRVRDDYDYIRDTGNCARFVRERGYILDSSQKEKQFPIAFSILFYKDVQQMERLLRTIYRPHNVYCLHLDGKSPLSTLRAVRGLASCLPNVFLSSRAVSVEWGQYSVLEPELTCMGDLWPYHTWRYFINLTGQEFPLKTNLQLVEILSALNGSNDVDCTTSNRYGYRWYNNFRPPDSIRPRKGNVHIAASRAFVGYLLHSPVARRFLEWAKTTEVPDETFFSSLNHNPHLHVPGAFLGPPDTDAKFKPYLSRFKNWGLNWRDKEDRVNFNWPCNGKRVRTICIFGVGDLPLLTSRKEMFANKFHADFEPLVLDCLEQWLWNLTMDEYSGRAWFNVSFYQNLNSVHNHVVNPEYG
ncbi:hypothetical protein ACOMHN_007382 [Nucella lapillus]